MSLKQDLDGLRPAMAAAAQSVIDDWQQDEEGVDPELGCGGVCDRVATAIIDVLYQNLDNVSASQGAPEGDDHEWVVVKDDLSAFIIDIPACVYETGGGYCWRKIEGASVSPQDIVIVPLEMELAGFVNEENVMRNTFEKLASALEASGDLNNAALVRIIASPIVKSAGWTDRFFRANPELLERADRFTQEKNMPLGIYLEKLDAMPEDMGRRTVHKDLGYIGMPWRSEEAEQQPQEKPAERKPGQLIWPFPPPEVLKSPGAFMSAAMAWAKEPHDERYAAKRYLNHLMKKVAPELARDLQAAWQEARGDKAKQYNLRLWWKSLIQVWDLLQDMKGYVYRQR